MFIEAIIVGIIVGIIRRGKVSRLTYVKFNMKLFIYLSAILYLSIIIMNLGLFDYSSILYTVFLVIIYISIGIFIISNIKLKFMFITLIGLLSNFLVLVANKFKFPLSSEAVTQIYGSEMTKLLADGKIKFFMPSENAVLSILGNIIPISNFFVVSIGDIIICIGIILIVQNILSDKYIQNRGRIKFSKKMLR